jgi:hypothetical protein
VQNYSVVYSLGIELTDEISGGSAIPYDNLDPVGESYIGDDFPQTG